MIPGKIKHLNDNNFTVFVIHRKKSPYHLAPQRMSLTSRDIFCGIFAIMIKLNEEIVDMIRGESRMGYEKDFFQRLLFRENWPGIVNSDFLDELNEIADNAFNTATVEGYLASILIYHQLTEEMIKIILEYSHFFIQCNIFPTELNFKQEKNKMFGYYLGELEQTIYFDNKDEFIKNCRDLNQIRISIVHKLTKKNSITELKKEMLETKAIFDKIYELFSEIEDWFMLCFKDFKKNYNWDIYIDEYEDDIGYIKSQIKEGESKEMESELRELEEVVAMLNDHCT
jgi:hypothetical protein